MQLRDRTLKLHASRPTVMEAFASNIPARRSFAKALDFWPYTTSFSCHDKCQWARRNPFFLSRQLQRAAVRPRPRVSGFTWDIPVLWQEIIAFEYVQASTRHISSCALRNVSPHFAQRTQHTFPRLPSRDRAAVVVIVGEVLKIWRACTCWLHRKEKLTAPLEIHPFARSSKNSFWTNLSRKNSRMAFFLSKIEF